MDVDQRGCGEGEFAVGVRRVLPAVGLEAGRVWFDHGGEPGAVAKHVYAMSCLGRERVFAHAAATHGTRVAVIRLNYACDLRYGVLAGIGGAVLDGRPVPLATGHVNVVW